MEKKIEEHLNKYNFDIRESKNARFMDQKVTPDVLCIIADCVLQFLKKDVDKSFTTKDIWDSDYANENVKDIFNKPDVLNNKASHEYDKFFAQPLKMLSYAKILNEEQKSRKNNFKINNKELLEYISIKEKNSLNFIILYLDKVLKDSKIFYLFDNFFRNQTKENFEALKSKFEKFIIENTNIKETLEPRRIFTKILNPLSFSKKSHGTKKGFLSKNTIDYDELMYNRRNWRDLSKKKDETREEYKNRNEKKEEAFVKFTIEKAKRLIRQRHKNVSEVKDELQNAPATQVHHIFPKNEYKEIESYLENLILLTPNQHLTKAHPNNNTKIIDRDYQCLCLLYKSDSIMESVENIKDGFYSKDDFIFVLKKGLGDECDLNSQKSFDEIKKIIVFE